MLAKTILFHDAGIDWITCTASHEENGKRLAILSDEIITRVRSEGNIVRSWTWQGYQGYQSEGIRAGARPEDVILQLSSETAKTHWYSAAEIAGNISRLDVQATAKITPTDPKHGNVVYRDAVRFKKKHRPNLTVGMVVQHEKGMTTMIGSRQSDRYLRCYDKFAESKDRAYVDCWRYEVEYKGDRAFKVAQRLRAVPDIATPALELVLTEFADRGHRVPAPFRRVSLSESSRKNSTIDRRIAWAVSQWCKLIEDAREVGRLNEVLTGIGLTEQDARDYLLLVETR